MAARTVEDLIAALQALPTSLRQLPVRLRLLPALQPEDATLTLDLDGGVVYVQQDFRFVADHEERTENVEDWADEHQWPGHGAG